MIILRILLMAFNVTIVVYLVYHLIVTSRANMSPSRKAVIIVGGILFLLVPVGMLLRIVPVTPLYFILYPSAIVLFVYLTRGLA